MGDYFRRGYPWCGHLDLNPDLCVCTPRDPTTTKILPSREFHHLLALLFRLTAEDSI